jgi:hypothetical protein
MASNHRRTLRVAHDLPVEWRDANGSGCGRALNLSLHGLLVHFEGEGGPDGPMDLMIHAPGGVIAMRVEPRFAGETRHGGGVGVEIVALTREAHDRWVGLYRTLAERVIAHAPGSAVARYLRRRTGSHGVVPVPA